MLREPQRYDLRVRALLSTPIRLEHSDRNQFLSIIFIFMFISKIGSNGNRTRDLHIQCPQRKPLMWQMVFDTAANMVLIPEINCYDLCSLTSVEGLEVWAILEYTGTVDTALEQDRGQACPTA